MFWQPMALECTAFHPSLQGVCTTQSTVASPPSLTLPLHAAVSLPATCLRTLPLSKSPVLAVRMEHISVFPPTLPALTLLTQGQLVCDSETPSHSLVISPSLACQLMGSTAFVW